MRRNRIDLRVTDDEKARWSAAAPNGLSELIREAVEEKLGRMGQAHVAVSSGASLVWQEPPHPSSGTWIQVNGEWRRLGAAGG